MQSVTWLERKMTGLMGMSHTVTGYLYDCQIETTIHQRPILGQRM